MDAAFANYLALSDVLMADGQFLLDMEKADSQWQRMFIRNAAALIEGYSHCFRDIAKIGLEIDESLIPKADQKALTDHKMDTDERIKRTLKVIYRLLQIAPYPNFGDANWCNSKLALQKRHALMHPKTVDDLEITSESWEKIYAGLTWLIEQHFNVMNLIHERAKGNS